MLLLNNHGRFLNKNCVLTVLQLFKKINFRHFFAKFTFRVNKPGKWRLSGYIYPESEKVKMYIRRYFSLENFDTRDFYF